MKEKERRTAVNPITKEILESLCLNHSGKMSGMVSISTSVLLNKICQFRQQQPGSVCGKCYSQAYNMYRHSLAAKLEKNHHLYTEKIIPYSLIPILNYSYVRFEAFADLNNVTQAINYLNIVKKNKHCNFAIWSKNPGILYAAYKKFHFKRFKNLIVNYSSEFINKPNTEIVKQFIMKDGKSMINHVFTVFTAAYAIANNIVIHCGNSICIQCLRCYMRKSGVYVNEILKQDASKYYAMKGNK